MPRRPQEPITEKLSDLSQSEPVTISSAQIAAIAETLGTDQFTAALLTFGQSLVKAEFVSIFCLSDEKIPLLLDTACTVGHSRAALAAKGYEKHFQDDVDYQLMMPSSPDDDYSTYQVRDDIMSLSYRQDCYDTPRIADRRSVLRKRAGYALRLSYYRSKESGEFNQSDRLLLDGVLPMLLALTERHIAFRWKGKIATVDHNEAQLAISYPDLTKREREVTSLTIKGLTAAQIAQALGVAETTVITHRNNAYQRLGVSNLRELMRL